VACSLILEDVGAGARRLLAIYPDPPNTNFISRSGADEVVIWIDGYAFDAT
jgi:hypothetical protein